MSVEPTTILGGLAAAFSVIQGVSGFFAGREEAAFRKAEGKQALATGQAEATRQRRIIAAQQSQLTADVGASGTTMAGSPMEVYLANAREGELQAQDRIYAGQLTAFGKKQEAALAKRRGTSELLGGIAGAASKLGPLFKKT